MTFVYLTLHNKNPTTRNKRKCRTGSNLHQPNITLNISTNYVLQPAESRQIANDLPYSLILRCAASRNIIYCLLEKPYFNGLCIDDMQISKEIYKIIISVISGHAITDINYI
jgi:hypothetical protein